MLAAVTKYTFKLPVAFSLRTEAVSPVFEHPTPLVVSRRQLGRSFPGLPVAISWLVCGGLLCLALCCRAAETNGLSPDPNQPLGLRQALDLAYLRNWDLLAAKTQVNLADAQRILAHEFPDPTLSGSVQKINVNNQPAHTIYGNGLGDRSYDTIVAVNQLIEIGGKRLNRRLSSQAGYEGARARFSEVRRGLELGVSQAYIAAVQSTESARILADSAASLRKEATVNAARLKAGDIATNELLQIEVTASRLELDARTAADASVSARIQLAILLGLSPAYRTLPLADSLTTLASGEAGGLPAGNVPQGSDLSLVLQRPDLVAARKDIVKARADLDLARAQRIPDPTVLAQWEHEPPDQNQTVGFGLSFPLPLWNRNRGAITAAQANLANAEIALQRAQLDAAADLAIARQQTETTDKRVKEFVQNLLPKSAAVRESISFAYQKGGASLIDLLSVQRTDNELRLASAQAAADAANARAALGAALTQFRE